MTKDKAQGKASRLEKLLLLLIQYIAEKGSKRAIPADPDFMPNGKDERPDSD